MILARFRRARRIFAVAALLCTAIAVGGAHDPGVAGERQIRERAVAQGDVMSSARAVVVEVARRLGSQDRSAAGHLLVPHDPLAVVIRDIHSRTIVAASVPTVALSRPRRLTFRYEATAPPLAL
jgi:hypothetical protein